MGLVKSFVSAFFNVVLPALILTSLSSDTLLGPFFSFLLALILPLSYGIVYFLLNSKISFFSLIGIVSIVLTGSFGMLELSSRWLIAKETMIPLVIGFAVLATSWSKKPFIFLLLSEVMNIEKIKKDYIASTKSKRFVKDVQKCNFLFASVFFMGAILNFILASFILRSAPGSSEYASEVARLATLSYPVIVVPIIFMLAIILLILSFDIEKATGKEMADYMKK